MLKGKVIVIAGACGRIGRALSEQVLKAGAIAILADINVKEAQKLSSELLDKDARKSSQASKLLASRTKLPQGAKVLQKQDEGKLKQANAYYLDCKDEESINALIQAVCEDYGQIDGFVNTTYPQGKLGVSKEYLSSSFAQMSDALSAHLASFMLTAQIFAKYFTSKGSGVIVNLSSIMGLYAPKFEYYEGTNMISPLEYSVIKAGINQMTRFLAKLLFNTGVRVNALAAGGIEDSQPQSFLKAYRKGCASKGMLDASDVCGGIVFLLSDAAKYVNGQILLVDDGWGL